MAKPTKHKNGVWTLLVRYANQRRNLTLGKISDGAAYAFAHQVTELVDHVRHGGRTMPEKMSAWIKDLPNKHRTKLGELGLFDHRPFDMTVGQLLDAYVEDYQLRTDVAESTKKNVRRTVENRMDKITGILLDQIEPIQKTLSSSADPIFSDEAKRTLTDFNSWQRNHFAPPTWTRDNKMLSSVGIWAVQKGLCQFNPFVILPKSTMVNDERNIYVRSELILDAMEATLSPDVRVTLALGRFAGLRTCSEIRTMKWQHVDWEGNKLTIIDSKKKKPRTMPLFENVRTELERQRERTGDTRFVVSERMRSSTSSANYIQIGEAVSRAGHEPWERLRQNLRTSCENDLLGVFEERLVTLWIGHTTKVSREHYQKMRAEDYADAVATASKRLSN